MVEITRFRPDTFGQRLGTLFAAMTGGGGFGEHDIKHFNGGLFHNADVLDLTQPDLAVLLEAAKLDWDSIEPSIFGTLFERGLDPAKRSQLGAHYTSRADILLIVEPVLMAPLRRRWRDVQADVLALMPQREGANTRQQAQVSAAMLKLLQDFAAEIASVQVLDPACGSGNFLYVALRELLDLEKEVISFAATCDLSGFFSAVGPEQMHGIELNEFAAQLAPITVNIGFIQWKRDNAFGQIEEPILKHTKNILNQDAILAFDTDGKPVLPDWPRADVVIGNPPFLGGNRIRQELGDAYVEALFKLYEGQVPASADLVCYWFEKAQAHIAAGRVKRAGLIATQGIRGGVNRRVLERIKETGGIFWAQSDRNWLLNGATVHVSMVAFDNSTEQAYELDGKTVVTINADLTSGIDLTKARRLRENSRLCFRTDEKGGPFDIDASTAQSMLSSPLNPNGRPNSDVVRPYFNYSDITRRPRNMYIIDFGVEISEADASFYELPFEHVRKHVKPEREKSRNRPEWWLHRRPAPDMRQAVACLNRFAATGSTGKHRIFVWLDSGTIPDHAVHAFAREDDYFFGVLHSYIHEIWARATGTQLREAESGFRYTPTTTFETFPFPWPPGQEPADDPKVQTIAAAACALVEKRNLWLNPEGADATEIAKRTLTNLYNTRPTWLDSLHKSLDAAVLSAYGWPADLPDAELLERLLALNADREASGTALGSIGTPVIDAL